MSPHPSRLVDKQPSVSRDQLLAGLVPPPQFADVRLSTFRPDPEHPSQAEALATVGGLVGGLSTRRGLHNWLRRAVTGDADQRPLGLYLDGGFGVGKTHLLASAWHEAPPPKAYLSFTQLTQLVGAVGFPAVVARLSASRLVCIDEFELDDPGDTVLVSTLLNRVAAAGARIVVTSNTLPEALGEGRFDTADFVREIQSLADRFQAVRIDGPDFRHRGGSPPTSSTDLAQVEKTAQDTPRATLDDFPHLVSHLRGIHPSNYASLIEGVSAVCLRNVCTLHEQSDALRLVVLVDRLYEQQTSVVASGAPLHLLFDVEMLRGGYRKKYLRAISRISALTEHQDHLVG